MKPMRITDAEKMLLMALRTETFTKCESCDKRLMELLSAARQSHAEPEPDKYLKRIRRQMTLRDGSGELKIPSARIEYCPDCNPVVKLMRVDIDDTYAEKRCQNCKRRFTYFRPETDKGQSARMAELRYQKKVSQTNASA